MMRYKVGDTVKIREDLEIGELYGGCLFLPEMQDFAGKIACIKVVSKCAKCYRVDTSCFLWTDEMFEDGVDMQVHGMNKHVGIYVDKNKVIAVNLETGKEGVARCHPDDDFDFFVGAKLALERLEEAEKPYAWLEVGMTYYVPEVTNKNIYDDFIYAEDDWDKRYMERGIVFHTREEAIACAKKMLAAVKQEG